MEIRFTRDIQIASHDSALLLVFFFARVSMIVDPSVVFSPVCNWPLLPANRWWYFDGTLLLVYSMYRRREDDGRFFFLLDVDGSPHRHDSSPVGRQQPPAEKIERERRVLCYTEEKVEIEEWKNPILLSWTLYICPNIGFIFLSQLYMAEKKSKNRFYLTRKNYCSTQVLAWSCWSHSEIDYFSLSVN